MNPFRGWEIYPNIVYDMGMRIKEEYGNIEWFVAENGMGVEQEERFKTKTASLMISTEFHLSVSI